MSEQLAISAQEMSVSYKVYPDLPEGFKARFASKNLETTYIVIRAG